VEEKLEAGTDVILEIDIQGAMNVKKSRPESTFIFILPPSMDVLRKRLTGRGTETEEAVELRLSKTKSEVSHIRDYDYYVVNDDLEQAVAEAKAIFTAEHQKVEDGVEELLKNYGAE
jgi:guanylate kinase